MNLQSRILIANLPSFAVAAIDLLRVIQIVWLSFNQTTVNGDENIFLAVFQFQIKRSIIMPLDLSGKYRGKNQNFGVLFRFHKPLKSCLFSKDFLKKLVRF